VTPEHAVARVVVQLTEADHPDAAVNIDLWGALTRFEAVWV
jgi:hypothetical protein